MVARVRIENIDGFDFVEKVLLRVGAVNVRHARVETGAEQGAQARFFEAFPISPLPGVFKLRVIRRFVVRRIDVVNAGVQTRVHQRQILIRERNVDQNLRLKFFQKRDHFLYVVRIDFRRFNHNARRIFDVRRNRLAFILVAGSEHDFAELRRILSYFVSDDVADPARTDDKRSFFHKFTNKFVS